ncbi:MAG TPA: four helix bundle protein [Lacibacter sp.]|nr:four helix bundle protein [Lacibacter sp.]
MAVIKKFEEIIAWQNARILCNEIASIIVQTDLAKDYKLKEQVNGSSGSIMDNIAEGFGRGGNAEFIQFLEISHGSGCECQSQLYRIADRKYISPEKFTELYGLCEEVNKMIRSLIHYLSASENKGIKYKLREK